MKNHKLIESKVNTESQVFSVKYEGGAWADMIIVPKNNGEYWNVILHTDWGVWSYSWSKSGMGKGINNFLVGADDEYLIDKFTKGRNMIYDGKATASACRTIVEKSFIPDLNKWEKDNLEDEFDEIESFESPKDFMMCLDPIISEILGNDSHELIRTVWHPCEQYFFENIFPDLISLIKKST